ncbi:MAG: HD domain-containing protein [Chloroflexaceae bacterium]|nr:HD domain-containing protein [Chloroflexaceae bacterium]
MVARLAGTLYTMQWMNSEMQDTCDRMLDTWSQLLALHPQESIEHIYGVAQTTLALARFLRLNENVLVHVWRGALLHDIGKIGIPKRLLQKPGPLDATEWRMMRQHPLYAYELLWPTPFLRPALDIPLYHHEKWDGTGYPYQLKGEDIPLAARLFAIVDVWYSLSEERLYRSRWNEQHIRDYIQLQSGRHFDPTLVAAFFAWRFGTAWTETLSY